MWRIILLIVLLLLLLWYHQQEVLQGRPGIPAVQAALDAVAQVLAEQKAQAVQVRQAREGAPPAPPAIPEIHIEVTAKEAAAEDVGEKATIADQLAIEVPAEGAAEHVKLAGVKKERLISKILDKGAKAERPPSKETVELDEKVSPIKKAISAVKKSHLKQKEPAVGTEQLKAGAEAELTADVGPEPTAAPIKEERKARLEKLKKRVLKKRHAPKRDASAEMKSLEKEPTPAATVKGAAPQAKPASIIKKIVDKKKISKIKSFKKSIRKHLPKEAVAGKLEKAEREGLPPAAAMGVPSQKAAKEEKPKAGQEPMMKKKVKVVKVIKRVKKPKEPGASVPAPVPVPTPPPQEMADITAVGEPIPTLTKSEPSTPPTPPTPPPSPASVSPSTSELKDEVMAALRSDEASAVGSAASATPDLAKKQTKMISVPKLIKRLKQRERERNVALGLSKPLGKKHEKKASEGKEEETAESLKKSSDRAGKPK